MAHILELGHNKFGLTSILNVSQKVGPTNEGGINNQNDVDAVEKLMLVAYRCIFEDGLSLTNNGIFDPVTGYYIYRMQANFKREYPATILDGIISPAKGFGYGGDTIYSIVVFNGLAKKHNSAAYEELKRTFKCIG
jgi:hypothetical protein